MAGYIPAEDHVDSLIPELKADRTMEMRPINFRRAAKDDLPSIVRLLADGTIV